MERPARQALGSGATDRRHRSGPAARGAADGSAAAHSQPAAAGNRAMSEG
jgi:hypothetical protein